MRSFMVEHLNEIARPIGFEVRQIMGSPGAQWWSIYYITPSGYHDVWKCQFPEIEEPEEQKLRLKAYFLKFILEVA